ETGQRVDLVQDGGAVLLQEQVHPRQSPAAQGAIERLRRLANESTRLRRNVGWNDERGVLRTALGLVFLMDLEEPVGESDAVGLPHDQIRLVPQDGATDLAAGDSLLDHDLRVEPPCSLDRTRELFASGDLAHAE